LRIKPSHVVPANAGTHSHWPSLLESGRRPSRPDNLRRGVWVPAFAGTTKTDFQCSSQDGRSDAIPINADARGDGYRCALPILRKHTSAFSRRVSPEVYKILSPRKTRGRRECRVLAAPAVSCAIVREKGAHEHTGTVGAFRHSLRSGFTAYAVLSPETNSSCLRRRRIEGPANPGWASQDLRRLDASNGHQDHTVLPSAATLSSGARCSLTETSALQTHFTRPALPRPPHPAPYVRDDRDTPL